ncbi:3-deoxy-manno-octulosonate cytidylyltransferase [bacterium]|nr:3-deoxy-manno-octulosonate cytidylyltransferase [bacterium]
MEILVFFTRCYDILFVHVTNPAKVVASMARMSMSASTGISARTDPVAGRQVDLSRWLVVVPARLASSRLPEKPLVDLGGKPLVVRVYENLRPLAESGARIVVAIDDDRVAAVCRTHEVPFVMTSRDHATGTDRCAEAARIYEGTSSHPAVADARLQSFSWVLNVQGDEPFIDPLDLIRLCESFSAHQSREKALHGPGNAAPAVHYGTRMASMFFRSRDHHRFSQRSCVKVVCSKTGHALYFSRSPIPCDRDGDGPMAGEFLVHMGVYAFDRQALDQFCQLPPSPLEMTEKLEQLRALEVGWRILMHEAPGESLGIDTPADLEAARARYL